jgi:hypothetical protein
MTTTGRRALIVLVSCSVADALSVQVRVAAASPGGCKQDQCRWPATYPLGHEVIVDASSVKAVSRPVPT